MTIIKELMVSIVLINFGFKNNTYVTEIPSPFPKIYKQQKDLQNVYKFNFITKYEDEQNIFYIF